MIEVTPAAAEQIRAALSNQTEEGLALRVAARRAANGETEYGMGLDARREQDEEVVTDAGITLLVSPPSLEAIEGTVIDFVEVAPGEQRFIFYRAGTLAESTEPQAATPDPTAKSGSKVRAVAVAARAVATESDQRQPMKSTKEAGRP